MRISNINQFYVERNKPDNMTFKSNVISYLSAKNYVSKKVLPKIQKKPNKIFSLWDFDLNKLEGIQYKINVFKTMTMKEIALFLSSATEFATFRGCHNNCSHCYADAKPPLKETSEQTSGMTWEDFISLIKGIRILNKRLGFMASGQNREIKNRYLTPFHDSDCLEITMKDKNGNIHDFIDISKQLNKALGVPIIFDTASWNPKSKKYQERAEKYVKFMSKPQNKKMFYQINVSLNPFHAIHTKEIELRKQNKPELADKMRDYYTTRMANTLFTFTPLIKSKQLRFLASAAKDRECFAGYQIKDVTDLFNEILDKLFDMYSKDLNGEQKNVKSEKEIDRYLTILVEKYNNYRYISFSEKAKRILNPDTTSLVESNDRVSNSKIKLKDLREHKKYQGDFYGIIDANGDYFLTDFILTIPTEIKLNFKNNKKTASINPNLTKELILTKKEINEFK